VWFLLGGLGCKVKSGAREGKIVWETVSAVAAVWVAVFGVFAKWPELWWEFRDVADRLSMNLVYGTAGLFLGASSGDSPITGISGCLLAGSLSLVFLIYIVVPRVVRARTRKNPYEGRRQPKRRAD
jgi:hypothetical protein